jgi:hypothetical protein
MTTPALSTSTLHIVGVASCHEPTPPSVRIVSSMQDPNTATTTRAGGGASREPVMDRTAAMRVSRSARATHSHSFPFFSFSFLVHTRLLRRRYLLSEHYQYNCALLPDRVQEDLRHWLTRRRCDRRPVILNREEQTQDEEPAEDRRDSDRRDDANWPRHGRIVSLLTRSYVRSHQILKIN